MNILDKIIAAKRTEVASRKAGFPEIVEKAESSQRISISFSEALKNSPTGIIAEFKRKSPSRGYINRDARLRDVVKGYRDGGAAAISVLTDWTFFGGGLEDLAEARGAVDIPLLRKDFVIDPYQIAEAKVYGGDAVLLIAAALTPEETRSLASRAHSLGLEVLLEIHCEAELGHICPEIDVVGVNNRDLQTFTTDIETSVVLSRKIPGDLVRISESGISSPRDVKELRIYGYRGFLMGENFMKCPEPHRALAEFISEL